MKAILIVLFLSTPVFADPYIVFNQGQVTSWEHRPGMSEFYELDPIEVLGVPGNKYAINMEVLSDPAFESLWDELLAYPVEEFEPEDFLPGK